MIDLDSIFSAHERAALALLVRRGFEAFTAARLEDVRELATGKRRRTFRNRGRYDLVLALRRAAPAEDPDPETGPQAETPETGADDPEAPETAPQAETPETGADDPEAPETAPETAAGDDDGPDGPQRETADG